MHPILRDVTHGLKAELRTGRPADMVKQAKMDGVIRGYGADFLAESTDRIKPADIGRYY